MDELEQAVLVEEEGLAGEAEAMEEAAGLRAALAAARSELAAYRAGVRPEMVGDAMALAAADWGENPDEAAMAEVLGQVLGRHPEWKAGQSQPAGFVVGSDPALGEAAGAACTRNGEGRKRWNRFNGGI